MKDFALGLIEGFYGRQWSWQERDAMASFLADNDYSHYIYAPKGDSALRSQWREPFSSEWLAQLQAFSQHCHQHGLKWGLGLSPMGLHISYNSEDKACLKQRIDELVALRPDCLWILFDDMRGDHRDLAANQCAVIADAEKWFGGELAVCPSYYSFDPVLDEVFGQRPENYLAELSVGLPERVAMLWTGAKVISESLSVGDCLAFTQLTGRKPLLWDNYPVNDGRVTSKFLHLNAFSNRDSALAKYALGHFANPMNQPNLSRLPLKTLSRIYAGDSESVDVLRKGAFDELPSALANLLDRDWHRFQYQGLDSLDEEQRQILLKSYNNVAQSCQHSSARQMAREVSEWLSGDYTFDPDCLTG